MLHHVRQKRDARFKGNVTVKNIIGIAGLTLSVLLATTSVSAKQTWAAYEGRDAIQAGQGGTKVQKNGIDYWTSGTPPHRFQVLGMLTDARKDRIFDGDVIGSKSIASKVKEAGGDAVIVMGASSQVSGYSSHGNAFATGNGISAFGGGRVHNRTTTQLAVVK